MFTHTIEDPVDHDTWLQWSEHVSLLGTRVFGELAGRHTALRCVVCLYVVYSLLIRCNRILTCRLGHHHTPFRPPLRMSYRAPRYELHNIHAPLISYRSFGRLHSTSLALLCPRLVLQLPPVAPMFSLTHSFEPPSLSLCQHQAALHISHTHIHEILPSTFQRYLSHDRGRYVTHNLSWSQKIQGATAVRQTSNTQYYTIHSSELESAWSLELGAFARCPSFKFDRQFNLGESRIHESTYSRLQDSRTLRVSCGGRQRRCVTST